MKFLVEVKTTKTSELVVEADTPDGAREFVGEVLGSFSEDDYEIGSRVLEREVTYVGFYDGDEPDMSDDDDEDYDDDPDDPDDENESTPARHCSPAYPCDECKDGHA